jgi:hypothetical protein
MLSQVRGSKELEIVLNYDTSDRMDIREHGSNERMQLSRLKLAIQYRQKKVFISILFIVVVIVFVCLVCRTC